jgi:hypothetical protein
MGIQEAQRADRLHIGRRRYFLLRQKQLIAADVLGTESIGWFTKMPGELGYAVQIDSNGDGRVVTDLEVFQHPLSKWGHRNLLL